MNKHIIYSKESKMIFHTGLSMKKATYIKGLLEELDKQNGEYAPNDYQIAGDKEWKII